MRGHWLQRAGFPPNGHIRVRVLDGCLVMTCEPPLPAKTRRP
ncbi:SymE family type I addiction module toxin [Tahibacter harae]